MNDVYDLARQNRQLIAEAEHLRRRLRQTIEELEEVRAQAERQRREAYQRRIAADLGTGHAVPVRAHKWRP